MVARGLELRPVRPSDAGLLIAANRASVALHHPWVHPFTDQPGFEAYFASLDGERNVGLVAWDMQVDHPVGVMTLSQIVRGKFQSAYLGFYGLAGQTGRGLMTHALRLTMAHAFGALGLHRVEANVQPDNLRSKALIERVGFRKEGYSPRYLNIGGEWRDHERWAMLAEDSA